MSALVIPKEVLTPRVSGGGYGKSFSFALPCYKLIQSEIACSRHLIETSFSIFFVN